MTDRPKKHTFNGDTLLKRLRRDESTYQEYAPEERYLIDMNSQFASSFLRDSTGKKVTSGFVHLLQRVITTDPEKFELFINVHSATVPHSWFNVSPTNLTINLMEYPTILSPHASSFTLPRGNYTHAQLCEDLSVGLSNVAASTITVSHSTVTGVFYITAVSDPEPAYPVRITLPGDGLGTLLGFTPGEYLLYDSSRITSNTAIGFNS
jgi:hypothetical protein